MAELLGGVSVIEYGAPAQETGPAWWLTRRARAMDRGPGCGTAAGAASTGSGFAALVVASGWVASVPRRNRRTSAWRCVACMARAWAVDDSPPVWVTLAWTTPSIWETALLT